MHAGSSRFGSPELEIENIGATATPSATHGQKNVYRKVPKCDRSKHWLAANFHTSPQLELARGPTHADSTFDSVNVIGWGRASDLYMESETSGCHHLVQSVNSGRGAAIGNDTFKIEYTWRLQVLYRPMVFFARLARVHRPASISVQSFE
jgi:hypothetical protein